MSFETWEQGGCLLSLLVMIILLPGMQSTSVTSRILIVNMSYIVSFPKHPQVQATYVRKLKAGYYI